MFNFLI